jgi:hypothetical protein
MTAMRDLQPHVERFYAAWDESGADDSTASLGDVRTPRGGRSTSGRCRRGA